MKKNAILLAALMAASAVGSVEAASYASRIRVGTTAVPTTGGTSISYVLNEPATSVTIQIVRLSVVVATFPGTTTAGLNTVSWNGTVNNGAGANVGVGSGYKVVITTTKSAAAGYAAITSQGHISSSPLPVKTALVNHAYPKSLVIQNDQTSDQFGTVLVSFGYASYVPPCDAATYWY